MKDLHTLDKYRDRDFGYRIHGGPGDAGNGAFEVYVGGRRFSASPAMEVAGST